MPITKWNADDILSKASKVQRRAIDNSCAIVTHSIKTHFPDAGMSEQSRSLPGEIPFRQTGTLSRSIGWEIVTDDEGRVGPRLGFQEKDGEEAANYGGWLELGTPKMKPRPYLRPGLDRERNAILKIFGEVFPGK